MLEAIAIYGGTFDPVHKGHIDTAIALDSRFHFDEIRFLPCKKPVLKSDASASSGHRVAMLKLALSDVAKGLIDEREILREGPSYMVDSLASIRMERPKASLCLVMGMDAFNDLPRWHQWSSLLEHAHIIVINRPGYHLNEDPKLKTLLEARGDSTDALKTTRCGKICLQHLPEMTIASSEIRRHLQANKPVDAWLSPAVADYIRQNKLYIKTS